MKTLTIQNLLNWAFVHELPKGGGIEGLDNANSAWRMIFASSWDRMNEFAELLTNVDRDPSSNFLIEQGEPHEDALAIGQAVTALRDETVDIPAGWNPMSDWVAADPAIEGLVSDATARAIDIWRAQPSRRAGASIVSLIVRASVLGGGPDWTAEVPEVVAVERGGKPAWFLSREVTDSFGRVSVIEVDGFNPRAKRPHAGAYQKIRFVSDPTADILARLDHQIWVSALRAIEDRISGKLKDHALEPWLMSVAPWQRHARVRREEAVTVA